ncbi:MAG: hypothetical protein IJQ63_00005 [Synergistaceae bacterium]|nr:hypothetical protein [Synergistaceae bacterium]
MYNEEDYINDEYLAQFWVSDEEDYNQPTFDTLEEERRYFLGRITKEELDAILGLDKLAG